MNPKLRAVLPTLLTISGGVTGVNAVVNTVRRGRLDSLGALVVLEVALSAVLFLVVRDPRVVLVKPSFYTALAGLYLLYTCLVGRPFTVETSKPLATAGDPARIRAHDEAAAHSAGFRRVHTQITAVWGVLWLVESAARVVVVLDTSIADGVLAGQLPGLVAFAVGLAYTKARVPALRRLVPEPAPELAS